MINKSKKNLELIKALAKVDRLKSENVLLKLKLKKLCKSLADEMNLENNKLTPDSASLSKELIEEQCENLELRLHNKRLKSDNVDLQLRNESLRAYCTSLEVQIDEYNDNPSTPLDL